MACAAAFEPVHESVLQVYVGYNKNVASYSKKGLESFKKAQSSGRPVSLILRHMNAYKPDQLEECFQRNAEVHTMPLWPQHPTCSIPALSCHPCHAMC